ncbi:MAG TPA: hypothetical protein VGR20_01895 [Acidimicrobiia bacterium]|nr:hypothetical protein [Acidimicrobiia bacterium]
MTADPPMSATGGASEAETVHEPQAVALLVTGGRLPGAEHALFRGYAPLVALVALILAMALLAPTIAPERDVTTGPRPAPASLSGAGTAEGAQR